LGSGGRFDRRRLPAPIGVGGRGDLRPPRVVLPGGGTERVVERDGRSRREGDDAAWGRRKMLERAQNG